MILRLPLRVQLFNDKNEVVQTINSSKKSQVRLKLHGTPRTDWQIGVCRVTYNKDKDLWNEFMFTNMTGFDEGLADVTEKPLIDFFRKDIPKEYLTKREPTLAQKAALLKARSNSIVGAKA